MTNSLLAYKFVALAMMLAEINFCGNQLNLHTKLPIKEENVCSVFIPDPKFIGFGGRIDTYEYSFCFAQTGRLRFIVKLNHQHGMSLIDYQKDLSSKKSRIDTNGAYNRATNALMAIGVNVSKLEKFYTPTIEQRNYIDQPTVLKLPIFDVQWGPKAIPIISVTVSGIDDEVVSIRQQDDSYSTRPRELIKNTDRLLAIRDDEFLKMTREEKIKLIREYAAVQYGQRSINH